MKRSRVRSTVFAVWAVMTVAWGAGVDRRMLQAFEDLVVLEGGRPMPMNTYARLAMWQICGRPSWNGRSAAAWIADLMFDPEKVHGQAWILVNHPDVLDALGLPSDLPRRRVSYLELQRSLPTLARLYRGAAERPSNERTVVDREFLRLGAALELYAGLSRNDLPAVWPQENAEHSPWLPLSELGEVGPAALEVANLWRALAKAWREQDRERVVQLVSDIRRRTLAQCSSIAHLDVRLNVEAWLNRWRPFSWATAAYVLAALAWVALGAPSDQWGRRTVGSGMMWAGWLAHTVGLVARTFIMERPPVTNLYSTFVFVGWVVALAALWPRRLEVRRPVGIVVAALAAALLAVAARYEAEGDVMAKVVAVLDSNFWLTAHVLTITLGYAGCLLAGALAHWALWVAGSRGSADASPWFHTVRGYLAFGLTLTFLGTALGGVWADQSWGRFWGWDPKENGALLIVLWTAAVFHARAGNLIDEAGLAAGAILTVPVVLTAWLAINLLGIGLHSYGFSQGTFAGWVTASVAEVVAAVGLWMRVRRRRLCETVQLV
jgi:ABC-type transport system involved in cytochrome c biogenesis permease subunit